MAVPLALATLLLAALKPVNAQFGGACDGSQVPDVAALQNLYPPIGQVAQIVQGDTVARNLFQSIQIPAFQPSQLTNGAPNGAGYDYGSDPQCWWTMSQCYQSRIPGIPQDGHFCPPPNTWGLSFDDGPTCAHAPLYQLLASARQQATLFYIGANVASYPNEARLGYNSGHMICVHTWSHHYTTSLSNEQIFAELYYTKKIIKDVIGVTPRCWRPPYGDVDDRVRAIANALELWTMGWSADTFDWSGTTGGVAVPNADYQNIINGNYDQQGVMVLTHEVDATTVALFQQHFAQIQQRFQHVVSAHTCFNITAPYAETTAPIYNNWQQQTANPQLQALHAPGTAGTSGTMFFSGQAAFLASLNGTNISPVASSSSSAMPSSTSAPAPVAAPSSSSSPRPSSIASAKPSVAPVILDNQVNVGAIAGAVGGGVGAAILLACLIFLARRRGWLCFDAGSRRRPRHVYNPDHSLSSPDSIYKEKFASSEQALLSPMGSSIARSSLSELNLPGNGGLEQYRDRLLSSSSVDVSRPYTDATPPVSPKGFVFRSESPVVPPSPRRSLQVSAQPNGRGPSSRSSAAGGFQYISQT